MEYPLVTKGLGICDICGYRGTVIKLVLSRKVVFSVCPKCEKPLIDAIKVKARELKGGDAL